MGCPTGVGKATTGWLLLPPGQREARNSSDKAIQAGRRKATGQCGCHCRTHPSGDSGCHGQSHTRIQRQSRKGLQRPQQSKAGAKMEGKKSINPKRKANPPKIPTKQRQALRLPNAIDPVNSRPHSPPYDCPCTMG